MSEADKKDGYYVFKCDVAAKEMTSDIKAQVIDPGSDKSGYDYTYSIKEYAYALLSHSDGNWEYTKVAPLVKAMLNYGTAAQNYFDRNTEKPANADLSDEDRTLADPEISIADPVVEDLPEDTTFEGATLSLKSQTSLSLYFTDQEELTFTCVDEKGTERTVETVRNGDTQIARIRNIPASELQYKFNVSVKKGETESGSVTYSPMNYCYKALNGGAQNEKLQNVVKALYWYSQEAYDYFYENIVDLGELRVNSYEAKKGDVLTGKLKGNKKITVAAGATVTLRDAYITGLENSYVSASFAGITLLGDATVNIEGTNAVKGGYEEYPGIFVPENHTLTINGGGSLDVSSYGSCGIGGIYYVGDSGNIVIKGGTIRAVGGAYCAAIGSACFTKCGTITISGGTVTAIAGINGAGIGSGGAGECAGVFITGGTVNAEGGDVEYGTNGGAGIGCGGDGSCLDIIISGGTVTAKGGQYGAGIGSGGTDGDEYESTCGNITITKDVIHVTAIKGENAQAIGNGYNGTCGTITIDPDANVTWDD